LLEGNLPCDHQACRLAGIPLTAKWTQDRWPWTVFKRGCIPDENGLQAVSATGGQNVMVTGMFARGRGPTGVSGRFGVVRAALILAAALMVTTWSAFALFIAALIAV
jgi:hypothetical protein